MKPKVTKKYLELMIHGSTQRVLEVLFRSPEQEFSLSDLAKEAGVAKPHIGKILAELERLGLISIAKLPKIWRIRANRENRNFLNAKMVFNLNFVYQSGLVDAIGEHFGHPKAMVLFGSFRRGEDFSSSDIDIAIETDETGEYQTGGLQMLSGFEQDIGRKIQIHVFSRKTVDPNVFNNIANGIVLSGFLEVRP